MTGLYENIEALQNEKHLTFLYRAPKLLLPPLSLSGMAERYEQVFDVPHTQALSWAKETNGYSFAFQALGYAIWNHPGDESASHAEFRLLLEEYVYEKIWTELSPKDKRIVEGIAHCPSGLLHDITDYLKLKPDEINQYRKRLIRKGIVTGEERGILRFTLPLFDAFVLDRQTLS